jgi:hypothetical protein
MSLGLNQPLTHVDRFNLLSSIVYLIFIGNNEYFQKKLQNEPLNCKFTYNIVHFQMKFKN